MTAFPFELADQIAAAYESIAIQLDAQADHHVRAFTTPGEGFSGVKAEAIRVRVGDLSQTEHDLADEARQAAGAIRDLVAEAHVAAHREGTAHEGPPVPLHGSSATPRRAI
jgi:hypothetical protein